MGSCQSTDEQILNQKHAVLVGGEFRGFVQPCRYALKIAGFSFKEIRFKSIQSFRSVNKEKYQLTSSLPLLNYNGYKICYSIPIVKAVLMFANRTDMLGRSIKEASFLENALQNIYQLAWRLKELNYDKHIIQKKGNFLDQALPVFQQLLETTKSGTFLLKMPYITICDLFFFQLTYWMEGIFELLKNPSYKQTVSLSAAYQSKFQKDSPLRLYLVSEQFMERPFFCYNAYWQHNSLARSVK